MRKNDIVSLQKRDHTRLLELMSRYEGAGQVARKALYVDIVQLVTTHAFGEEAVLFPTARWTLPNGEALTAAIEARHQKVNDLMKELDHVAPGEAPFEQRVTAVFELLREDLTIEEEYLLPALAERLGHRGLSVVGRLWLAIRRTAPNRPHPRVSRRPPGNVLAALPLAIYDRLRRSFERASWG